MKHILESILWMVLHGHKHYMSQPKSNRTYPYISRHEQKSLNSFFVAERIASVLCSSVHTSMSFWTRWLPKESTIKSHIWSFNSRKIMSMSSFLPSSTFFWRNRHPYWSMASAAIRPLRSSKEVCLVIMGSKLWGWYRDRDMLELSSSKTGHSPWCRSARGWNFLVFEHPLVEHFLLHSQVIPAEEDKDAFVDCRQQQCWWKWVKLSKSFLYETFSHGCDFERVEWWALADVGS